MSIDDRAIHFVDEQPKAGSVTKPLVFAHSLGCDLEVWANVAAALADTYRVVRYDLAGHGLSDCGEAECAVEDHACDLDALLEKLGISGATLLGISIGGMIAITMAAKFSQRVRRLVLCATGARIGTREMWDGRIAAVRTGGLESIADTVLGRWFAPGFAEREPAIHRGYRNRLTRTPMKGYIASRVALRDADVSALARNVDQLALVLSGEHDVAAPPSVGRELASLLPRARFEAIAGVAHLPPVENPAATVAAIRPFLAEPA